MQEIELLHTGFITHDTKRFVTTRPDGLDFEPGQGVEIAIDRDEWRDEGRPFTPTSLPDDPVLEFTIKEYPEHEAVTRELHRLESGAGLRISESFGAITWKGPGVFLAGGAGVTPFLAILRRQAAAGELGDSVLHFANKTPADVICEKELRHLLGERCLFTCTRERTSEYDDRRIDRAYLEAEIDDFDQPFYVCGPPQMVEDLQEALLDLGAESDGVVVEE